MFSALSGTDRMAAVAAIVVAITAVISLAWAWGVLMLIPLVAALFVLFVVFKDRVAPNAKLPMARGMSLLIAGAAAALIWVVVTFQWIGYILEPPIFTIDTIQFLIGLVASLVLLFAGWRAYQAESSAAAASPPPAPPAPPAA
jgi:hypothetical protein